MNGLARLAKDINAEHDACLLSAADAVTHAINAGKMLIEVKAGLKHGEFMPWVAEHCRFKKSAACKYMSVANFHSHGNLPQPDSLNHALRMLADESNHVEEEPQLMFGYEPEESTSLPNGEPKLEPKLEQEQEPEPSLPPEQPKPPPWTKSERERRKTVERGGTVTANLKTDKNLIEWAQSAGLYIRIDRNTAWGNPYILEEDGDRIEVIESYGIYLGRKWGLQGRFEELRGKVLGCWCYPERCHGNVLIEQLEGAADEAERVGCHS